MDSDENLGKPSNSLESQMGAVRLPMYATAHEVIRLHQEEGHGLSVVEDTIAYMESGVAETTWQEFNRRQSIALLKEYLEQHVETI